MQDDALFADVFSNQSSLIKRLAAEFAQAADEFLENPTAYVSSAFKDPSLANPRRRNLLRLGLAIALVFYVALFSTMLLVWVLGTRHRGSSQTGFTVVPLRPLQSLSMPDPPPGKGDTDPHGGGGGGRDEDTPATVGAPPLFEPAPAIIAPTTRLPLNPPSLPVMENLVGNPDLNTPRDLSIPTGLPDGVVGPPSDGPGSNGGIGTGTTGGVGPGDGPGLGPGRDGGFGGDTYTPGGGRRVAPSTQVDSMPVAMNEPRPNYTEEARAHKVQGVVRARILIGSDGFVKQMRITRGLPDGLDEEAIRAATQMRFRPAMKGGTAVAFWMTLDVEFNLR
jgi:TonB family protein